MDEALTAEPCSTCEGSGLQVIERPDGSRAVRDCQCRVERRAARRLQRANIPPRFANCTMTNFKAEYYGNDSISHAKMAARKLIDGYPINREVGLMFVGPNGVGKTHLSVAILKGLIARGASGLFCTYGELLKEIQNTYNKQVQSTESQILEPVIKAEVLVLDEIGSSKPSDWVLDTFAHILNTRYNERRMTILTTNRENRPPLSAEMTGGQVSDVRSAIDRETLGDRIGERARSRIHEMCLVVPVHGEDARQGFKAARAELIG